MEYFYFFRHKRKIVVRTTCPVPACIIPQTLVYGIGSAIKYNKRVNGSKRRDIFCLTCVARNAVQNQKIFG